MQEIFIVGSKGIPAKYGGYETFVEELTSRKQDASIHYYVACKSGDSVPTGQASFQYNGAECVQIHVPKIGPAQAIYYDIAALQTMIKIVKKRHIKDPIFYILACRIGPLMSYFVRNIHKIGGQVWINPDGHEWKRAKWSLPVRHYWKKSEELMVKHADLVVCDSVNIQKYIEDSYSKFKPNTTYVSYGADCKKSNLSDDSKEYTDWIAKNNISQSGFYLIVGRFVPENNYESMLREFMLSKSARDLVIITNVKKSKFYETLKSKTHFTSDKRVKFVGTVYNSELLKKIREQAYAYIHGHSVGGTNPSLLEALASTRVNLLFDVGFNREVARDGALYWTNEPGVLASLIERVDSLDSAKISVLDRVSLQQVQERYSWNEIVGQYESLFLARNSSRLTEKGSVR